jgi:phage terminase small subunit|tara:strand:+ start:648 stop:1208 length:561 start_codon:yes stop_codon:yes gene_type:complete
MAKAKVTHKNKLDIVANPRVETGLTPMQEKFATIYATEEVTQTEAALKAGYAESNAHAIASRMLNGRDYPQVLERVRQIKNELQHKFEVSFESHVRKLAQIRDEAMQNGNFAAAVSAEKSRGQAAGLYIDRKEIMMGKIDQMSREEVMKEIQKMQEEFPQLVEQTKPAIDVDYTDIEVHPKADEKT